MIPTGAEGGGVSYRVQTLCRDVGHHNTVSIDGKSDDTDPSVDRKTAVPFPLAGGERVCGGGFDGGDGLGGGVDAEHAGGVVGYFVDAALGG